MLWRWVILFATLGRGCAQGLGSGTQYDPTRPDFTIEIAARTEDLMVNIPGCGVHGDISVSKVNECKMEGHRKEGALKQHYHLNCPSKLKQVTFALKQDVASGPILVDGKEAQHSMRFPPDHNFMNLTLEIPCSDGAELYELLVHRGLEWRDQKGNPDSCNATLNSRELKLVCEDEVKSETITLHGTDFSSTSMACSANGKKLQIEDLKAPASPEDEGIIVLTVPVPVKDLECGRTEISPGSFTLKIHAKTVNLLVPVPGCSDDQALLSSFGTECKMEKHSKKGALRQHYHVNCPSHMKHNSFGFERMIDTSKGKFLINGKELKDLIEMPADHNFKSLTLEVPCEEGGTKVYEFYMTRGIEWRDDKGRPDACNATMDNHSGVMHLVCQNDVNFMTVALDGTGLSSTSIACAADGENVQIKDLSAAVDPEDEGSIEVTFPVPVKDLKCHRVGDDSPGSTFYKVQARTEALLVIVPGCDNSDEGLSLPKASDCQLEHHAKVSLQLPNMHPYMSASIQRYHVNCPSYMKQHAFGFKLKDVSDAGIKVLDNGTSVSYPMNMPSHHTWKNLTLEVPCEKGPKYQQTYVKYELLVHSGLEWRDQNGDPDTCNATMDTGQLKLICQDNVTQATVTLHGMGFSASSIACRSNGTMLPIRDSQYTEDEGSIDVTFPLPVKNLYCQNIQESHSPMRDLRPGPVHSFLSCPARPWIVCLSAHVAGGPHPDRSPVIISSRRLQAGHSADLDLKMLADHRSMSINSWEAAGAFKDKLLWAAGACNTKLFWVLGTVWLSIHGS